MILRRLAELLMSLYKQSEVLLTIFFYANVNFTKKGHSLRDRIFLVFKKKKRKKKVHTYSKLCCNTIMVIFSQPKTLALRIEKDLQIKIINSKGTIEH